jgi:hypothetical protein
MMPPSTAILLGLLFSVFSIQALAAPAIIPAPDRQV